MDDLLVGVHYLAFSQTEATGSTETLSSDSSFGGAVDSDQDDLGTEVGSCCD